MKIRTYSDCLEELKGVIEQIQTVEFAQKIDLVSSEISDAVLKENKLMFLGNGGSAAEAQHMAAEYMATLNKKKFRKGYPAISLTTDTSFLTAWSNDFGLEEIFSRQVETIGKTGDILFAYSTSGRSQNVIKAIRKANSKSIYVIGFSGNQEGSMTSLCDICFSVPSDNTARIQEIHTFLGHTICETVENKLSAR